MNMIAIGNGEKCPYCDTILDDRVEGREIMGHLLTYHSKEVYSVLFGESENDTI